MGAPPLRPSRLRRMPSARTPAQALRPACTQQYRKPRNAQQSVLYNPPARGHSVVEAQLPCASSLHYILYDYSSDLGILHIQIYIYSILSRWHRRTPTGQRGEGCGPAARGAARALRRGRYKL